MSAEALFGPEPLEPRHDVSSFGCGVPALDDYLIDRALADARAGKSQTQVACRSDSVVAYYSLAAGSVEPGAATGRATTGQGRQPIPVIVLARSAEAASLIGIRAVLMHAKDGAAKRLCPV